MFKQLFAIILAFSGFSAYAFSQQATPATGENSISNDLVVAIASDEDFYVGKDLIERSALVGRLKAVWQNTPPDRRAVYIKAMCSVKYGVVVSLIDDLRGAGMKEVGLLADKNGAPEKMPARIAQETGQAANATGSEPVVIELESTNRVKVNSRSMPTSKLQAALRTLLRGKNDRTVFVTAPAATPYCDVVKVIDLAKAAPTMTIGLRTL